MAAMFVVIKLFIEIELVVFDVRSNKTDNDPFLMGLTASDFFPKGLFRSARKWQ